MGLDYKVEGTNRGGQEIKKGMVGRCAEKRRTL